MKLVLRIMAGFYIFSGNPLHIAVIELDLDLSLAKGKQAPAIDIPVSEVGFRRLRYRPCAPVAPRRFGLEDQNVHRLTHGSH
jgi:hypothetical protein